MLDGDKYYEGKKKEGRAILEGNAGLNRVVGEGPAEKVMIGNNLKEVRELETHTDFWEQHDPDGVELRASVKA